MTSQNPLRYRLIEIKKDMNPRAIYFISFDDVIVFSSKPLVELLKEDPSGNKFSRFLNKETHAAVKESMQNLESGISTRLINFGFQTLLVDMEVRRELINERIFGVSVIKKIKIIE